MTLNEIVLIISLALVSAAIIVIIRLWSGLNRHAMQLNSLLEVDKRMISGLSHQGIMNAIHDKLIHTMHPDASAIVIKNHSEEDRVIAHNLSNNLKLLLINSENGIVHAICEHRKIFELKSIDPDENESCLQSIRREGYRSFLGAPIITKGGVSVGILSLLARRSRAYSRNEKAFVNAIASQIGLALDRAQLINRIQEMHVESVKALVKAIEARDPYTEGHSVQVSDLAVKIARVMNMNEREIKLIEFAGLLHDVGKIVVPESVLKKTSGLDEDEWTIIKQHPGCSSNIIEPIVNLRPIRFWLLYHHERWDGKGYPEGIKANAIPLPARILSVCDTYSAMTSDRPYRKAIDHEFAVKELISVSGSQLDPNIVQIFVSLEQFAEAKNVQGEIKIQ